MNTVLGVAINENLDDQVIVTVIATGFEDEEEEVPAPSPSAQKQSNNFENTMKTKVFEVPDEDDDEDVPAFLRNRRL